MSRAIEAADREFVERFIARMDRGDYWLAHEELEPLWLQRRDDSLKGLIHLAAALVHLDRGNWPGAERKAASCARLLGNVECVHGLRLEPVREAARQLEREASGRQKGERLERRVRFRMSEWHDRPVDTEQLEEVELPYRVRRYEQGYRIGRDPDRRDA